MKAKTAATIGGLLIAGLGFGVGIPIANANQPTPGGGGECNNYGNSNIIVAPFCGASFTPLPAGSTPTTTTSRSTLVTSTETVPSRLPVGTPEPTRTCLHTVPGVPCTPSTGGPGAI